jgi:rod shape-determining protein MreC
MVVYRRDTRSRNLLAAIIVVSVALITIDTGHNGIVDSIRRAVHTGINPVRSAVDNAFQPLRDLNGRITSYESVKDENGRLRREFADLRGQLQRNRGIGSEVNQLQALLDLPTVEDATGIAARVSGGAPGNFERTVQLDKGADQGVRVGYAVVTGDGLVGTITDVATTTSTVTLIDNPKLGVGVSIENTQLQALTVASAGERTLRLTALPSNSGPIAKGTRLFTAAIPNAAFPGGEPVGVVTSYTKAPQDVAPTVTVATVVNLDDLDFVKVLRWPDPTAVGG